jgi:hypothetical protein
LSPDDPMSWRTQSAWYSSWALWGVIALALSVATVWSWRRDHNWY